ncbi:GntR family transcriptional regulator [Arthrobacter woluwensis]|uniref:GntR family transcriptional regulator n=1 Tax=Arthrobacter TaxID=1663 RepID=UPI000D12BA7C|nr:GntR family transcriptional regulator [Arthrobacter woluwensis]MBO9704918.1 GntR family transcriptional regulator [Arthrobacter sp.]MDQ0709520.1 DNA-binding GntR family transcriptional regulator [Arthrobacter woluwensis]PSS43804.1 GntR family transcriptional regulator [Arthrobacter woluwensis]
MSSTVTSLSKSQIAYEWIRERIARHEFGPGYRLVLGSIASSLDMSVVPVREAVRRLEAEGLVEFERNVGARVTLVDEQEYVHTMQTLGVVEGVATSLSAPHLGSIDLDRAAEMNERLRRLLDDFDPHLFTVVNQQFHTVLFEPCPNPHILDLVHRGWARMAGVRDSTFSFIPGRARESVEEHDHIIELIRSNASPLEIEMAARDHRWATMNAYLAQRHPGDGHTA